MPAWWSGAEELLQTSGEPPSAQMQTPRMMVIIATAAGFEIPTLLSGSVPGRKRKLSSDMDTAKIAQPRSGPARAPGNLPNATRSLKAKDENDPGNREKVDVHAFNPHYSQILYL